MDILLPQKAKNDENTITMYHNVRSLHAHIKDIKNDQGFMSTDLLILFETSTIIVDNLGIPNFTVMDIRYCENRKEH